MIMIIFTLKFNDINWNNIEDLKCDIYNKLATLELKERWYMIIICINLGYQKLEMKICPYPLRDVTSKKFDFYFIYNTRTKQLQISPVFDEKLTISYLNDIISIIYDLNKLQCQVSNLIYSSILDKLRLNNFDYYYYFKYCNNENVRDSFYKLSIILDKMSSDDKLVKYLLYVNNIIEGVIND